MKHFLLLLLFCLLAGSAPAQNAVASVPDWAALHPTLKQVILPVIGFYLLCSFVLATIKLILNFLLKRQIVASAVSENLVERLLPSPKDEQNKVVKWIALLVSSGAGLTICTLSPPFGLHSVIILLFSTALGFLAYYLFLRRQPQ